MLHEKTVVRIMQRLTCHRAAADRNGNHIVGDSIRGIKPEVCRSVWKIDRIPIGIRGKSTDEIRSGLTGIGIKRKNPEIGKRLCRRILDNARRFSIRMVLSF